MSSGWLGLDWGTVPIWVGTVFTSTSAVLAALTYRRSVLDRERDQASRVAAWFGLREPGGVGRMYVRNGSDAAVYDVLVRLARGVSHYSGVHGQAGAMVGWLRGRSHGPLPRLWLSGARSTFRRLRGVVPFMRGGSRERGLSGAPVLSEPPTKRSWFEDLSPHVLSEVPANTTVRLDLPGAHGGAGLLVAFDAFDELEACDECDTDNRSVGRARPTLHAIMHEAVSSRDRPELEFTDAAGRMWRRTRDGRLQPLSSRVLVRPFIGAQDDDSGIPREDPFPPSTTGSAGSHGSGGAADPPAAAPGSATTPDPADA